MSIPAIKKRGRPSVDSEAVTVRLHRSDLDALDQWISQQSDHPGRPEAIRRLMRAALSHTE